MSFTVQAVPFAAVSAGLVMLAVVAAILRGDLVVRLAFVLITVTALPWAIGLAIGATTTDPALALPIYRVGYAALPITGAGLLMVILAVVGKLDAHRTLVVVAVIVGLAMMVVAVGTDLVIRDVDVVSPGMLFPLGGPLYPIHLGLFAAWLVYAVWVSRRTMSWRRGERRQPRLVSALAVLALLSINDSLISLEVVDGYPLAWVPALIAIALSMWAIARGDLLRAHGVDRAVVRELIAVVVTAVAMVAIAALVPAAGRAKVLMLAATVAAGAVVIVGRTVARDVAGPAQAAQTALDRFADRVAGAATADEVARGLAELLVGHGLAAGPQVWARVEGGWWQLHGGEAGPTRPIAEPVEAWLRRRGAFAIADLATERLDERRAEIDAWTRSLDDVDVAVPLVDRDVLVGLAAGTRARPLRDGDRVFLDEAARAAARALTVLALTREVERRADLARELELAEAVRQARAVGDVSTLAGSRVAVIYQPAARVAGDMWSCAPLPDERLLVLVGDVAGRGLPAALVSAAIHGASQAAAGLLGARATPAAVLGMLHDTVTEVDGGRHRVTAMAAIIDRRARRVAWASAGHRGGYLLHPIDGGVELHALIARGTALGEPERVIGTGERALEPGDTIVLTSDGVVEARNSEGVAWGERRLQRTLRTLGGRGGDHLAEALSDAVHQHVGDAPHDDDILVVAIADPSG